MAVRAPVLGDTRDAFNRVAAAYDQSNTANPALSAMRSRALAAVRRHVAPGARLLELGCGPGTDSEALVAAECAVTAIDWAPAMVAEARQRVARAGIGDSYTVQHLGIHELDRLAPAIFDAAYSNFGPLNCVPDLGDAARQIAARLRPGGVLIATVIGRICPWEIAIYLARGSPRRASRRFTADFVSVPLCGGTVWTRYYAPGEFAARFVAAGMTRVSQRALGLFAPPPYLEGFAARHPRLTAALHRLDDSVGGAPGLRACGDHFLIVLRKSAMS